MKALNTIFAFIILHASCSPVDRGALRKELNENKSRDSLERVQEELTRSRRIDSLRLVVKKISAKCIAQKDEFRNLTFYSHKTLGKNWPNRKTIYAECNSEGHYYLRSNYHADDWLFHSSIQVKIGDRIIESEVVPSYNPNNRTEHDDGKVWENVTYESLGKAIISAIAKDPDVKVTVRFLGQKYYNDVQLSRTDKKAISDIFNMAISFGELKYYRETYDKEQGPI